MRYVRTFRSANTIRVTIPRVIRHALAIKAGDYITLEHKGRNHVIMRNASHEDRLAEATRKK